MRPGTRVEQERFEKSLLSRPAVWMVIFTIGLMAPLTLCDDGRAIAICLYGLLAGLSTAWFARGLALLKNPQRYPQILGGLWLLLNVLPAFAAVGDFSQSTHEWHPATLSPFVMLMEYADFAPNDPPTTAVVFYGLLFVAGVVLHRRHMRKGT